jgi:hypothetical protein
MAITDYFALAASIYLVVASVWIHRRASRIAKERPKRVPERTFLSKREVLVASRSVEAPPAFRTGWATHLNQPHHTIVLGVPGAAMRIEGALWNDAHARAAESARLEADRLLRRTRRDASRLHVLPAA